ncbi:GGDEF domain-containing protein [Dongshaea marina]|uniref:GGDEF domain-containing protein n=1 Tax=Dongshaea marina TaxID=2047966 RepID=UPI00131EFA52|nr:GGDEF domain-containing protein [Dongshaea marina]
MQRFNFNFEAIVHNARDVIVVTKAAPLDDPGPEIVYVNHAFTQLTGYSFQESVGQNPRFLQRDDDICQETRDKIRQALKQQVAIQATLKNYSKSGRAYWLDMNIIPLRDESGQVTHFAAIERDVTEQKLIEEQLQFLATTDPLTGLLNRRAFEERLNDEHSRFTRKREYYSVLMIDVDKFKPINDIYGHAAGDQALREIAQTFQGELRLHDSAARIGGDEFCILLPFSRYQDARKVAEKLKSAVNQLHVQNSTDRTQLGISIGIAQAEEKDINFSDTLRRADKALFKVKRSGRNGIA